MRNSSTPSPFNTSSSVTFRPNCACNLQIYLIPCYLMGTPRRVFAVRTPFCVCREFPCHWAWPFAPTLRSSASFSQIFFFGLSTLSGSPVSYPSTSTRSPGWLSAGGSSGSHCLGSSLKRFNSCQCTSLKWITLRFNYLEAHKTIPADSIPLILAGLRLHRTTTIRSFISASGTKFTRPLTTVRGVGSPLGSKR